MDDGNKRRGLEISVPEYLAETSDFRSGEHILEIMCDGPDPAFNQLDIGGGNAN